MGKAKRFLLQLVNLTPGIKDIVVRGYQWVKRCRYLSEKRKIKTEENLVVFESFLGRQYGCSPKALFLAMVDDPQYADYQKIWIFKEPEKYSFLNQYPNTRVVSYGTTESYRCYARAKYWITNYHLPTGIVKAPDQVYVQTWHGTPLKKIGCDVGDYDSLSKDKKRAWKEYKKEGTIIDYMPSPSPFYTEKIKSAFWLQNQAQVLELGYPRNDFLFTVDADFCGKLKEKLSIPVDKKVALYAPTWRDNQHVPGQGYVYHCGVDFEMLQKELGEEWVVLFRAHYLISNSFDFEKYQGFVVNVSEYDDVNHLYAVSDILITDYSSVFFDYANLNRPIFFYMYDYEEYKSEMRDFYFGIEELPGSVVKTQEALVKEIKKLEQQQFQPDEKYRGFNKKYNPHPVPCSSQILHRIVNAGCEK